VPQRPSAGCVSRPWLWSRHPASRWAWAPLRKRQARIRWQHRMNRGSPTKPPSQASKTRACWKPSAPHHNWSPWRISRRQPRSVCGAGPRTTSGVCRPRCARRAITTARSPSTSIPRLRRPRWNSRSHRGRATASLRTTSHTRALPRPQPRRCPRCKTSAFRSACRPVPRLWSPRSNR
jgi:hypothetical protein